MNKIQTYSDMFWLYSKHLKGSWYNEINLHMRTTIWLNPWNTTWFGQFYNFYTHEVFTFKIKWSLKHRIKMGIGHTG